MSRYITPEAILAMRFPDGARPAWDVGILCFRGPRGSQALVHALGARPAGRNMLYGLDGSSVYEAAVGDSSIVLATQCLWGGPQTAILVEELACLGVRSVIGFGVAGSLVTDLRKGSQVVAATGIVTDGTSRAYTPLDEVHADGDLVATVQAVAGRVAVEVQPVRVATVDALYRETDDDVRRWLGAGARAINMETAPLYATARACGVRSVWLGHISDSLASPQWESWERRPAAMTEATIALTVELLNMLSAGAFGG